jgi:DNA-binding Lrp family transcriptional regulator
MRARLDATDWRILKELQADGRLTNVALASRVGLSAPPCLRRVQALERAGFIRGYHAVLDPALTGFEVTAYALVTLRAQGEAELREFENLVLTWPVVREAAMLAGDADYILKCVARDLTSFQDFVLNVLTPVPNVGSVKTTLVLRQAKSEPGVPIETRR